MEKIAGHLFQGDYGDLVYVPGFNCFGLSATARAKLFFERLCPRHQVFSYCSQDASNRGLIGDDQVRKRQNVVSWAIHGGDYQRGLIWELVWST